MPKNAPVVTPVVDETAKTPEAPVVTPETPTEGTPTQEELEAAGIPEKVVDPAPVVEEPVTVVASEEATTKITAHRDIQATVGGTEYRIKKGQEARVPSGVAAIFIASKAAYKR